MVPLAAGNTKEESITVKVATEKAEVSISVRSSKACELQFYMFNLDGELVKRFDIKANTKLKIVSLSKGIYMYDVFHKDAKLKSGKIELKY